MYQTNPNDSLINVDQGPFRFSIGLPKDLMIGAPAAIVFNSATGELDIKIGDTFHIVLNQEEKKMNAVLKELSSDNLFENKILEQTESMVVYQQVLPTGEPYSFNFSAILQAGGKWYYIKSWAIGEFTLEQINRMKQAVETIHTIAV
ncbi:MAG: hypothetical protein IT223_00965 [Crocinitomicaceae bacterium]|nr:hypothetical protein [Crocinitomicaceae bacterium]